MAVTRIKNNQITDASGANVYLGVNATSKLQDYTVTSGKLANNLVYNSDLTVSGNLTVQGNTSAIDTTITTIEDPVILLASGQTSGTPAVDIGFIGARGNLSNIALVWDESADEFVTAFTSTGETNTTITISSYADFHTNNANIGGNIVINGDTSLVGNVIGAASFTGNITAGNLFTPGAVSATGNITGGNLFYGAGIVSGTGNIYAGNFIGNIQGNIDAAGANTQVQFNDTGDILGASAGFTFNKVGNVLTANGNINGANLFTGGTVSATGNVTGGNLLTAGVTARSDGNIDASGVITGDVIHTSGGNIGTSFGVTTLYLGNVNPTTIYFGGDASNIYVANANSYTRIAGNATVGGFISAVGNIETAGLVSATGNINTAGSVSAAGNVSADNVNTDNVRSSTSLTLTAASGDLILVSSGNINANNEYINNVRDPVQAQDAATKEYVDNAVSSGIHIHTPVLLETPVALPSVTYAQGGTTATVTATVAGNTVVFSSAISPQVNDQYWFTNSFQGILANTSYFVVSAPNTSAAVLSTSYNGAPVSNITSASGLTESVRINSGVGATLTAVANGALTVDSVAVSSTNRILVYQQANAVQNGVYVVTDAGNVSAPFILTRATDSDQYVPDTNDGIDQGSYYYVQSGATGAGESYVLTQPTGPFIIGYANIEFTQFSASQVYSANTSAGLSLTGTVFSAKVDNDTTAFDGGGNISVKAGANLVTPNIGAATGTSLSVTGNVDAGNIRTSGVVTATGNITGGNIFTGGQFSAAGNIQGGNIISGNAVIGNIDVSGDITVNSLTSNTYVSAGGNVVAGNVTTAGLITATGNITGGNVSTAGLITATGDITGGNLATGGTVSATGNVTGGNVLTSGLITATGNVTGGNFDTAGLITATGNVTGGNINTAGIVTATGNIYGGNLILSGAALDTTAGRLTVNSTNSDADFAVNGDTLANVFYVDAGTGTASFGSSTQVTNAIVNFATTTSIKVPSGNTAQRPATGVTGMVRFNTSNNNLELYDNSEWTAVGVPVFTVIADEQFAGDGSTVAFTLTNGNQTTNSCIVSINGVVQIPTLAYAVSGAGGNILTFTEAPSVTDVIDVREITTTTTVTQISNTPGNAIVGVSDGTAHVLITGDLTPTANLTYSLGNATNRWSNIYVGGNTIFLGNLQLKEASANTFAVFTADGITQANVDVGNVDVSSIVSGTSTIGIYGTGQAYLSVNGNANVLLASNTSVLVNGAFSATGNITGANLTIGNIVNSNSNGVGNIGSSSSYFNTVFAKATSAQYADLAEKYTADATYEPGTVVMFGGSAEVTLCVNDGCSRVAGVISTNPSYRMNDGLVSEHTAMVALTGRVPTRVTGTVRKGDMMVSAGNGVARAEADPKVGTVIGKAIEDFDGAQGVIEVVVGRL